ncbi:hypothetical protein M9Y90_11850 [Leptospira interrogans]|uniref:DUF7660 family protein n=1 Tax=Leptospira interrogans TaxID=173 RepID=UPI0020234449|nr:hypothetical protein [Leptospira interrogans]MCL8311357.1 hypothetical protein [Leptospira interrogans]
MTPDDINAIHSDSSFIEFLEKLCADLQCNPSEWENRTLADFLEGMLGFAHCMKGYYENQLLPVDLEKPGWREFANILAAARVYE